MKHITRHDRRQTLLLPEAVDDYVGAENPVRFIDAFVDGLGLAAAGFARVVPEAPVRPGYAPGDLLKLYIYGYLNRVRSSRRLEAETRRNLEVIWLLRHLKPDFKTIADFRRDNRAAFRSVFGIPRICPALPAARPVRPRAAGGRRHADQSRQQQGPQLHASIAGQVHSRCRQTARRLCAPAGRGRCREDRDWRRLAYAAPHREDCGPTSCWRSASGAIGGPRTIWREPGLADRS